MTPEKQIAWTLSAAGREFGVHRDTLKKNLGEIGEEAGPSGHYTTAQITKAIFGDVHKQRLRKTTEEADKLEMENRERRGELIELADAIELVQRFCFLVRQEIILAPVPEETKQSILATLRGLKSVDFTQVKVIDEPATVG